MEKNSRTKWQWIDEFRSNLHFVQLLATLRDATKGLDIRRDYNGWFLERCKTLATNLDGNLKKRFPEARNRKSLHERLEILCSTCSDYEPDAHLTSSGRMILGRTHLTDKYEPSLQVSSSLGPCSPLRGFIAAHELTHLLVHLRIPDHFRIKSHSLIDGGDSFFEELFDDDDLLFAEDGPTFTSADEVMSYIKAEKCDARAGHFQERREAIFWQLSNNNLYKYYREIAADLTAAFLPVADFSELYELLYPETKKEFEDLRSTDDDKILMHFLDWATWIFALKEDPAERKRAGKIVGDLIHIGFETELYSPLQIVLGVHALINFKIQPRFFGPNVLGQDIIKTTNMAFFGAVGIDVSHAFKDEK